MHLLIPCSGFGYQAARNIAVTICDAVHALVPNITTTNINISSRGNLLFVDPNQNDYADTIAAPYSERPYHLPTFSMPLDWKELNSQLENKEFTIKNALKRIEEKGICLQHYTPHLYRQKTINC